MRDHPRFQPWLLLVAIVGVLPVLLQHAAPVALRVMAAALVVLAAFAWGRGTRPGFTPLVRDRWALAVAAGAVIGFTTLVTTVDTVRWSSFLLLGAALIVGLSASRSRTVRWTLQAAVVASLLAAGLADGDGVRDLVGPTLLLIGVGVLADAFVRELRRARHAELTARTIADQRTDLLDATRGLPDAAPAAAARTVVDTIRSLGYDAAAALLEHDGRLHLAEVAGAAPAAAHAGDVDPSLRRAFERAQTVVDERGHLVRVIVPVLTEEQTAGVLVGVLVGEDPRGGRPPDAAPEIVEVLADHLGVVLATERQVRRQHELLDRMERLERMRSSFVAAVSAELRDPLTVVRGVGETLATRSDVDAERRTSLLRLMAEQTEVLRRTIDALLDFSRLQAGRLGTEVVAVPVGEALEPVAAALGGTVRYVDDGVGPRTPVALDLELVRHALELAAITAIGSGTADLVVTRDDDELRVRLVGEPDATPPSALVRALVAQLVVAGGGALAPDREVTAVLPIASGQVRG